LEGQPKGIMVLLKVAFKMKTDWHNYAIFETQFFTKEAKVFSKIKVKQEEITYSKS